ncbi:hypothetical protein MTO96_017851 [Rhipicephalus appendiculatus]
MASSTFTYFPGRAGEAKKGLQDSSLELLASIPEESSLSRSSGNLHRSRRGPLLCALVSLLLSATVLASCAVLVYVEVYYRWSFPLRVDCNLDPTSRGLADYGRCMRRGCKYVSTDSTLPTCFFPEDYGYVMESEERHADGSGFTALLKRPDLPPLFGGEFDDVVVNVSFLTPSRLRLQPEKVITFRTTGGLLDFDIFLGNNPDDVLRQFTQLVGRPAMPPLWALGHHVSVDPDVEISQVWPLLQTLRQAGIEVAALHLNEGIANGKTLTDDSSIVDEIMRLRNETKDTGIRYLLRADPLLPSPGTHMIPLIMNEDAKNASDTAFVDFTKPETEMRWTEYLRSLLETVGFDGLLLDMNEPTYPLELNRSRIKCPENKWQQASLSCWLSALGRKVCSRTACAAMSNQSAGAHYHLHNLYGISSLEDYLEVSFQGLMRILANKPFRLTTSLVNLTKHRGGQRPMILSRATFSGSGSFGGHWFEEPECSWEGLRRTIVKAIEFSMFGMPLVGGYCHWSNKTEDVRLAWLELSALLPLSVRRTTRAENLEEDEATARLLNASAAVLATRKLLLPYMYTVFYEAHVMGGAVLRTPFYEFPTDPYAMNISYQFLWGSAVLVSPRIQEDAAGVEAYFPAGQWCDFYTSRFVRELELFVCPDVNGEASGFLYWDDGITYYEDMTESPATRLNFTLTKEQKVSKLAISAGKESSIKQDTLTIHSVTFSNAASPVSLLLDGKTSVNSTYDPNLKVLRIESLSMDATNYLLVIF